MNGFTKIYADDIKGLPANEQIVMLWLLIHFNRETGRCFPSIRMLESEADLSRPTIIEAIRSLEKRGRVKADREKGFTTHYRIKSVDPRIAAHWSTGGKRTLPGVVKKTGGGGKGALRGVVKPAALKRGDIDECNQMKKQDDYLRDLGITPLR